MKSSCLPLIIARAGTIMGKDWGGIDLEQFATLKWRPVMQKR